MKKIILSLALFTVVGLTAKVRAQCSGASVAITNFNVIPLTGQVLFGFDWQFVQGNASLQVQFYCDNVFLGELPCIPRLKDSTAGVHHVGGTYVPPLPGCMGVFSVRLVTWTNPSCGGDSCQVRRDVPGAIILPASMNNFTAARSGASVQLKWQTLAEQNATGFAIERNLNGNWQQVGYVNSQALAGNSNTVLNYAYTDINPAKAVSQYRIRQADLDAKSKYSEIRSVRGEGQSIKTLVYPNPSSDGKVNIVFEETSGHTVARDIAVAEISGRVIKQMKGVTNNNIILDNLAPGVYSLRISIPATGEQSVEKIVVNKR